MKNSLDLAQINEVVEDIWSLIRDARIYEAMVRSEKLVLDTQLYIEEHRESDRQLLKAFAYACHVAGYTVALSTSDEDALVAVQYFHQMYAVARFIQDDTLLVIAQTYKGDMYRRYGNLKKAMSYLQAAYTHTPQIDAAALGNCAQFLARVYLFNNDFQQFEKMMMQAEKIARTIDPNKNSLHGHYSLGTVYIDYARSYSKLGQTQKALDYLTQAENELPSTAHWDTLLTATRGILVVKNGDLEQGMPKVLQAVSLCHEHGNKRLLGHLYALQRYLRKKAVEFSEAQARLGDALDGSFQF
jgi:tetratricopeptide (TPR) repeat protein